MPLGTLRGPVADHLMILCVFDVCDTQFTPLVPRTKVVLKCCTPVYVKLGHYTYHSVVICTLAALCWCSRILTQG